jgi:hypothetical protein
MGQAGRKALRQPPDIPLIRLPDVRPRRSAWLVPSIGLVLGGCSAAASTFQPPTADSTVRTYLGAVNAHRWKQAAVLLSPSEQKVFAEAPDSDRNNTISVTDVTVKIYPAPFERAEYPGFTSIKQALVTFDATYKKVYGAASGPQTRFVYVGCVGASGPWRILGIGTGP